MRVNRKPEKTSVLLSWFPMRLIPEAVLSVHQYKSNHLWQLWFSRFFLYWLRFFANTGLKWTEGVLYYRAKGERKHGTDIAEKHTSGTVFGLL